MGIEPTMSGDKCFTGTIDTLSGLARVSEPAFIVALLHVSLLECKKAAQSPERPWRKNLDSFSLQPLVLLSSCLMPIERTNDTKHVWGLRAYAHPLASRPMD